MSIAIAATHPTPVYQETQNSVRSEPKSTPPATADTVHLSSAAQATLSPAQAALQEATETQAQTGQEARNGDRQAGRLLAKETAAK
jgi:hypothetical protein